MIALVATPGWLRGVARLDRELKPLQVVTSRRDSLPLSATAPIDDWLHLLDQVQRSGRSHQGVIGGLVPWMATGSPRW
jgi:hypothetical protein